MTEKDSAYIIPKANDVEEHINKIYDHKIKYSKDKKEALIDILDAIKGLDYNLYDIIEF
ncbi:MAG: hypothetical protein GDA46_04605 [Bdellovibrionales bacterium]|nr:hypothetical protein [Bdellovibrionales bacterium]